jgi:hypothetical protein
MFNRESDTAATWTSRHGMYRMLASLDVPGAWMITPFVELTGAIPTYHAIPTDHYIYEIRCGLDGDVVGHAENLSDMAWPVEAHLIASGQI